MISNGTDVSLNLKCEKRISLKTNRYCDQEILPLKSNKKSKTLGNMNSHDLGNINSHDLSKTLFLEKRSGIVESKKKRGRPHKIVGNHSEKMTVVLQLKNKKCSLSLLNVKILNYVI